MNRLLRALIVVAMAAPRLAGAQSGITFDFRLQENVDGQVQSSAGHGMISGNNVRMDVSGPSSLAHIAEISLGDSISVISVDTGTKQLMSLLGHTDKKYLQFAPMLMVEKAREMGGMAGAPQMDFAGSKVTLDSIGPGGSIAGYNTVHFRLSLVLKMAMNGQPVAEQNVVNDFFVAPELKEFAHASGVLNGNSQITAAIPGIPKSFEDDLAAAQKRVDFGMAIRTETVVSGSIFGTGISRRQAIEASNIKRADIPASAFVVPSDYKKIALPGM